MSVTPPTSYYVIAGILLSVVSVVLGAINTEPTGDVVEWIVQFGQKAGGILFVGVTVTYLVIEVIVMLADRYKREQFQKGVEEANRKWAEWNRRRVEAERENRPFNDPAPNQHK